MGTRADFYVGIGKSAEWIGSIAYDGYETSPEIEFATTESEYREAVHAFLQSRDDATFPDEGWPWPWNDSGTTDCSYWFYAGGLFHTVYGADYKEGKWLVPREVASRVDDDYKELDPDCPGAKLAEYPDMSARKNVKLGQGSGLLILRS